MSSDVNLIAGLKILQLNISGFTEIKKIYLQQLLHCHNIDVALLQETHIPAPKKILENIPEYELVGATYHKSYGTATYVRKNIRKYSLVDTLMEHNIFVITVKIKGLYIVNVYTPPSKNKWPDNLLLIYHQPTIYIGDFNSHHKNWKYPENDTPGQELVKWSRINNLALVFDFYQTDTFLSNHGTGSNPDLCWVTRNHKNKPMHARRIVLDSFYRSGHRPIIFDTNVNIPEFKTINWHLYGSNIEKYVESFPSSVSGYPSMINSILLEGIKIKNLSESLKIKRIHIKCVRSQKRTQINQKVQKYLTNLKLRQWKMLITNGSYDLEDLWKFYFDLNEIVCPLEPKIGKNDSNEAINCGESVSLQEVTDAINDLQLAETKSVHYEFYLKYTKCKFKMWLANFFNNIIQKPRLPTTFNSTENQSNPLHATILKIFQSILFKKISSDFPMISKHKKLPKVRFGSEEAPLKLHQYINHNITKGRKVAVALIPVNCCIFNQILPIDKIPASSKKLGKIFNKLLNCTAFDTKNLAALHLKIDLDNIQEQLLNYDCQIFVLENELLIAVRDDTFELLNNTLKITCNELTNYFVDSNIKINSTGCCTFNFSANIKGLRSQKLKDIFIGDCKLSQSTKTVLKFGGCLFDQKLEYTEHIKNKITQLRMVRNLINLLIESEWGNDREFLLLIYNDYVVEKLLNCEPIWSASKTAEKIDALLLEIRDTISK